MTAASRAEAPTDSSTRERMLETALEAFAELGFDGASTREIAARAGVNQGLIPYYFGSKEALWHEAVDRAFDELRGVLGDLAATDLGDRDRIEAMIRSIVRFQARRPEFARLMHDEGKRDGPRMRWLVDRHVRPMYEATLGLAEQARERGVLPDHVLPLHFYYILVGASGSLFHQAPECRRLTGRDPMDAAIAEAHADALIALLLGPPERTDS